MVLQWCYSGVTVVLEWSYSGIRVVLQWYYSGAAVVLQWSYVGSTDNFEVTRVRSEIILVSRGGHKGKSRE